MFWYIGGMLAGFAIGYMAAIYQNRNRTGYKKGINDCRNCKYMRSVAPTGIVDCKQHPGVSLYMPIACGYYNPICEENSEEE